MIAYIEALILYAILFLPGLISRPESSVNFSAGTELVRIFMFNIPVLALIWYLLCRKKRISDWGIIPGRNDLFSGAIALPCLLIIGFFITYTSSFFNSAAIQITPPSRAVEWIILCISCISTGYMEESFFRFYLLSGRKELKLSIPAAVAVQAALFSICHIYEGPWGILNSLLSGILLSLVFLRYKTLHGIAFAHGLYNIAAYAAASIAA